jgi:hypothetical protein
LPKVDALPVSVWTPQELPEAIIFSRFTLSSEAHEVLTEWCREKTGRPQGPITPILRGLSEILAFFVPEVAYMKMEAVDGGERGLSTYFLGNVVDNKSIRRRVRTAISIWLGIVYPNKGGDIRGLLSEAAEEDSNWASVTVRTELRIHDGVCAAPFNIMFYDALTAVVARQLSGQTIRFASGHERTLVLQTPRSSLFHGVELVAFPPTQQRGGDGLWSEVVSVSTATYPERKQQGIHLLVRPLIRNWGSIRRYDIPSGPSRSLDVFVPSESAGDGYSNYRHSSFLFKALDDNWRERREGNGARRIVARWDCDESQRVFDVVGRLIGAKNLAGADLAGPVVGSEGRWVLPRLSAGHQDRYLAGGSGVNWPDRRDIAESCDGLLRGIGLIRAEPMHRLKRKMPLSGPFKEGGEEARAQRRAIIAKTVKAFGGEAQSFDLVVFSLQEATHASVIEEIGKFLGPFERRDANTLVWGDGLRINVIPALSGPLALGLPKVVLTGTEIEGRTRQQLVEIRRAKQETLNEQAKLAMRMHIRAVREGRSSIGCALLEMAASHKGKGSADPYAMARSEIASERLLPQVLLVEEDDDRDDESNDGDAYSSRIQAAVRDLLRLLGVMPFVGDGLPWAPAAIGIIQRNAQYVGGGRIQSQAFPLAVRTKDGLLQCAMPGESGEPYWMPYAEAALFIFSGIHERFARNRMDDNIAKFNNFFAAALEQINQAGPAIVLADSDTLSDKLKAVQNNQLTFDRLQIGNRVFTPPDARNIRIVRLSINSEKLPSYYNEDETQWPTGLFVWGDAVRTAYGLKRKPASAKSVGRSSLISRHLEVGDNRAVDDKPRRAAAIDEVCVIFCQKEDDFDDLRLAAHRLRGIHAQYDDDTKLPFPLHELRLLGKAVTS